MHSWLKSQFKQLASQFSCYVVSSRGAQNLSRIVYLVLLIAYASSIWFSIANG
jgi:hypothetical protein